MAAAAFRDTRAVPEAAILCNGDQASERGDLAAVDRAEFGHFCEQCQGEYAAAAGHRHEAIAGVSQLGMGRDMRVDQLIQLFLLRRQVFDQFAGDLPCA